MIKLILAGIIGILLGITVMWVGADRGTDEVATFNAGFSDSKLDDCQRGFVQACEWLGSEKN